MFSLESAWNLYFRWSFACCQLAGTIYAEVQDGQRIAVMGMFARSGQSTEFFVVAGIFSSL